MAILLVLILHPIPHFAAVGEIEIGWQPACRRYPTNPGTTARSSAAGLAQFLPQGTLHDAAQRRPGFERLPLGFKQEVSGKFHCDFHQVSHVPVFMGN
jgi:hypothetical protein